jgi:hypothetical protein
VSASSVTFRIAYARYSELRDDVTQQMARGGLLVKVHDASGLTLDTPVQLELVLPDGTPLQGRAQVLQVLAGFGVAVSVGADLLDRARRAAEGSDIATSGTARHERIDPGRPERLALGTHRDFRPGALSTPPLGMRLSDDPPSPRTRSPNSTPPPPTDGLLRLDGASRAEKIQKALHGTRDERNAILRDRDRTLHPFVLKNPQLNAEDIVAIAKNAQMTPEMLKQISDRKEWFQRPAIALALARNPKTPPELAVRALDYVPVDAVRQIAKGAGVLPHIAQAARKKLLG